MSGTNPATHPLLRNAIGKTTMEVRSGTMSDTPGPMAMGAAAAYSRFAYHGTDAPAVTQSRIVWIVGLSRKGPPKGIRDKEMDGSPSIFRIR